MAKRSSRRKPYEKWGEDAVTGERFRISLGHCGYEYAREFTDHKRKLKARRHLQPDAEMAGWLASLPDEQYDYFARCGLVRAKSDSPRLFLAFFDWVCNWVRIHKSPGTHETFLQTKKYLEQCFPEPTRTLASLGPADCDRFRSYLVSKKSDPVPGAELADATARLAHRNLRWAMSKAIEHGHILTDPFEKLPCQAVAAEYTRLITRAEALRVIDELPTPAHKLAFGLARFAGLRFPSEALGSDAHPLTWRNSVNWEKGWLLVYSPKLDAKSERRRTSPMRRVPIMPELHRLLLDAQEALPEGASDRVVSCSLANFDGVVQSAAKRAKVGVWPKTFQSLRKACENDWLRDGHPQHIVAAWMGHSVTTQAAHYATVTDKDFAFAAEACAKHVAATPDMGRNPPETTGTPKPEDLVPVECGPSENVDFPEENSNGRGWIRTNEDVKSTDLQSVPFGHFGTRP